MSVNSILRDFVKISEPVRCPNCKQQTKFIGETRTNGNWYCGFCGEAFPYKDMPDLKVEVPFTKLTDQLEDKPKAAPFGVAPVDFPMDIATSFLVPSYGSGIHKKKNMLIEQTEDYTRTGRIKSANKMSFDLKFNDKTLDEYETLLAFWETQGYHNPFNYTDPFRNTDHICFFDSEVEAEPASFDVISFSVRITE